MASPATPAAAPKPAAAPPLTFVLDKNLALPLDQQPWSGLLTTAGIKAKQTTDLVLIDQHLAADAPNLAYVPGADFLRLLLQGNQDYRGLVTATSKFTSQPTQRTLLVVRHDDPATSLDDLAGATYGYMNKSCSSSYFPPAILLQRQGKKFSEFFQLQAVPGWQSRVDAVVAKHIRATMILDDVWKMDPQNAQTTKVIGQFDGCPPATFLVRHDVPEPLCQQLLQTALTWRPKWEAVYGAFRPYYYADVQSFFHDLAGLPADL